MSSGERRIKHPLDCRARCGIVSGHQSGNRSCLTSDDERAIRDLAETWITATKAGDSETVMTLMADDVIFMVPGQKPFGKEAFASASKGMQGVQFEGKNDILEVRVLGDWAYMRTHLEVTMTPPGSEPMRRSGHTLSILRKEPDGRWVIARDANMLAKEP
jgi:uncharacterized protein (TIGR02246 family)